MMRKEMIKRRDFSTTVLKQLRELERAEIN